MQSLQNLFYGTTETSNTSHPQKTSGWASFFSLPSPKDSKGASNRKSLAFNLQEALKKLANQEEGGQLLPEVLQKLGTLLDGTAKVLTTTVGVGITCVGLFFLMGGAIHFVLILLGNASFLATIEGLQLVIKALIQSGAMPTLVSGATMWKFGDALMGKDNINWLLSTALWCFPPPWNSWNSSNGDQKNKQLLDKK